MRKRAKIALFENLRAMRNPKPPPRRGNPAETNPLRRSLEQAWRNAEGALRM
jgi:hypothetical protein